MTGEEAWKLLAPAIASPTRSCTPSMDEWDVWMHAYITLFIGTQLYDNWVANGRPEEWKEKPKGAKK